MSWSRVSLAEISDSIDYGYTASADSNIVGPKFLRITDIQDNHVDWASVPRCACSKSGVDKFALQEGDIVFARTGATTGKSYLLRQIPEEAVFASYLIRVRPRQAQVDPGFLARFFETQEYWSQINQNSSGTAQGGVNASKLKKLSVPLPPLPEQRHIAAILGKVDALRSTRREAIAKLDQLLQSVFLEMFGDPVTNPKCWPISKIGDECEISSGSTPSREVDANFDGGIPWVKSTEVNWGLIVETGEHVSKIGQKAARLKAYPLDTVVVALYGQGTTRGKCAILGVPATMNQACAGIYPSTSVNSIYLFHYLKNSYPRLRGESRGGSQENLNLGILNSFMLPVPPLELQKKFAEFAQFLEKENEQFLRSADSFEKLFGSFQDRAFSGSL